MLCCWISPNSRLSTSADSLALRNLGDFAKDNDRRACVRESTGYIAGISVKCRAARPWYAAHESHLAGLSASRTNQRAAIPEGKSRMTRHTEAIRAKRKLPIMML